MIMKLELVVRKDVSHVELIKDERFPLGIQIRDGTEDEAGPVIKRIKAKSLAERSYAVAVGDVILSLNGREVMGAKGKDIQWMLKEMEPSINLKVQYEIREAYISRSGVYSKNQMTIRLQKVDGSFGFILRKRNSRHPTAVEYPLITNIKPGGAADWNGLMQDGDRLLKVDDVSLSWLTLADIAIILQQREEAEFTFEYNIRMLDWTKLDEKKIDLMIDVPNIDLGVGICTQRMASHEMYIGSIRQGSVAERCGVFCKGDIILSVNGFDVEFLTVSKANSLLRYARKNRRILFLSDRGRTLRFIPVGRKCSTVKQTSAATSSSSIGIQTTDYNHLNTPASSSNITCTGGKSSSIRTREEVKAVKTFQDAIMHMTELKQCLSQLTREAFDENNQPNSVNEMCTCCKKTQHSITLCTSCIAEMNVKCAQSMDILRNLIIHYVAVSIDSKNLQAPGDSRNPLNDIYENPSESGVTRNLIHSLTKTLPNIFSDKPNLQKYFRDLAEKIFNADISCNSCKNDVNSLSITVQKLLLLISMKDNTTKTNTLINELVDLLLKTKFACDDDERSSFQSSLNTEYTSEGLRPGPRVLPSVDGSNSSKARSNLPQNIVQPQSNESESKNCEQSNSDQASVVNLAKQSVYYRISSTEKSPESVNDNCELSAMNLNDNSLLTDKNSCFSKDNMSEKSTKYVNSEVSSKNKSFYKDKGISRIRRKISKSLDSFLNSKSSNIYSTVPNNTSNNSTQGDNHNRDQGNPRSTKVSLMNGQPNSSFAQESNFPARSYKRKDSESNTESAASSYKDSTQTNRSIASNKTRRETVEVKIFNKGNGFGLSLGFSSSKFGQMLPVPIITAIKPKSPAYKTGVLKVKDRVLAINHESVVNIPLKELESLKRRVFSCDQVDLTVEFDVNIVPLRFGTFEVLLERRLKIGLHFEDRRKSYPMVVSAIAKGSAAYRCGQLFVGDKVMFLKSFRVEEYDAVTEDYSREETVRVTVQRDLENLEESPIKSSSSRSNPFSFIPCPGLQSGMNFIIKRTSVSPVEGTESLRLEQELSLFRDPTSWDFGFQVGEDPLTGRAYVTDVKPGGPACSSGVIKKFDRIVEVNGVVVDTSEERCVLSLLTQANDKVDLLIRRHYSDEMKNVNLKSPRF